VQLFSSLKKQGIEEAEAVIAGWFTAESDFEATGDLGPEE
jgi:hypothetical protein